jgi:hypothetical protein
VPISGIKHKGVGELEDVRKIEKNRFLLLYNIDGCSWVYEGRFDDGPKPRLVVQDRIVGLPPTSEGVVLGIEPAVTRSGPTGNGYVLSFTTATNPSQLYTFNPRVKGEKRYRALSSERVVGIADNYLSRGEDLSYTSFDGLQINARLYLPSRELGFMEPYPLVLYVHGGPQGQA